MLFSVFFCFAWQHAYTLWKVRLLTFTETSLGWCFLTPFAVCSIATDSLYIHYDAVAGPGTLQCQCVISGCGRCPYGCRSRGTRHFVTNVIVVRCHPIGCNPENYENSGSWGLNNWYIFGGSRSCNKLIKITTVTWLNLYARLLFALVPTPIPQKKTSR